MMVAGAIRSVRTGRIAPLGPQGVASAFRKAGRAGPVAVGFFGLEGDEQADRSVHGGPDKAVYCYAEESFAQWRVSHPAHGWEAGVAGENLTLSGLTEVDLCIGDTLGLGTVRLQICQPRQPCFKLALSLADASLPRAMIRNGLCGWYCRVLEPGVLEAGDAVRLEARPNPGWTVARMAALIHAKACDPAEIMQLAALPGLAGQWPERLRQKRDVAVDPSGRGAAGVHD